MCETVVTRVGFTACTDNEINLTLTESTHTHTHTFKYPALKQINKYSVYLMRDLHYEVMFQIFIFRFYIFL